MEALAEKPLQNATVAPGTLLISGSQDINTLVILQKGQVSVRYLAPEEPEFLEDSRFFYSLQAPAVLGGGRLLGAKRAASYVISDSECLVSVYPTNNNHLLKVFASKPSLGVIFLKTLLREIESLRQKKSTAKMISQRAYALHATMAVAFTRITPQLFSGRENLVQEEMVQKAKEIVQEFQDEGGVLPESLSQASLKAIYPRFVMEDENGEPSMDFDLVNRLVNLPAEILAAISQKDAQIFYLAGKKLAAQYEELFLEQARLEERAKEHINYSLVAENNWAERLVVQCELYEQKMAPLSAQELTAVVEFFIEQAGEVRKQYFRQWGVEIPCPKGYSKLESFISQQKKAAVERGAESLSETGRVSVGEAGLVEFENSAHKIIQWSELGEEKNRLYQELYRKIIQSPTPLEQDDVTRPLRRQINALFWEVYEAAVLKYLRNRKELPFLVELFLNTGFFDERYLDEEHLNFLKKIIPHLRKTHPKYPIYTPLRWLEAIYDKKVPLSINDLGVSYVELLRQEDKYRDKPWRRESDLPPELNTGEVRVKYEIQKVFLTQTKLTSGQLLSYFNPLNRYMLAQSLEQAFVSVDKLGELLDKLLSIDFSAFHREILYENPQLGITREFVQIEVIPNFILTPISGSRFQFWQDREGNDRYSRGRLVGPIFAVGELYTMLLNVVARYRWESIKTQMGPDWNNISKSSLTADYTDYVQFLHKNKELSPEMKEQIALEHKRYREDAERFAHDYVLYIKYESEGTQRLNRVVRRILTRHIPFSKAIREKLATSPVFADLINKSTNIRRHKAQEMRPRLEKYRRELKEKVPPEIEYTFRFYNMEF